MESDGPYKRTRSSTHSQEKYEEKSMDILEKRSEVSNSILTGPSPQFTPKSSKTKNKGHNRMPSGHLLPNCVGDIRNFFDQKVEQETASHTIYSPKGIVNSVKGISQSIDHNQASPILNRNKTRNENGQSVNAILNSHSEKISTSDLIGKSTKEVISSREINRSVNRNLSDKSTIDHDQTEVNGKDNNIENQVLDNSRHLLEEKSISSEEEVFTMAKEGETPQNIDIGEIPEGEKVMNLKLVIEMFKEIKKDLTDFKVHNKQEVDGIKHAQQQDSVKIEELKEELDKYKHRNTVMNGIVQRMSSSMSNMERRINELERQNMKNAIVISGLQISNKKKDQIAEVAAFLEKYLGVKVDIEDLYTMGEQVQKLVVVVLSSNKDKWSILNNKKKLKDVLNAKAEEYYINEHLQPEIKEKRRREREIYNRNEKITTANKVEMAFFKGGLKIQN